MREIEADYDNLFPADSGPLVRFILLQQSDMTDLVLMFNHSLYDGLSVYYVLRDIMYYLAQPDALAEPAPPISGISDLIPEGVIAALAQRSPHSDPPAPRLPQPVLLAIGATENPQLRVFSWALTEAQTTALIERCRSERTSVHAAICAAFMFAFANLKIGHESTVRTLATAVNLRARLKEPVGEALGLLIESAALCKLDCPPERAFGDAAREFKAQLTDKISDEVVFAGLIGRSICRQAHPIRLS
jgi:hypothetical protein